MRKKKYNKSDLTREERRRISDDYDKIYAEFIKNGGKPNPNPPSNNSFNPKSNENMFTMKTEDGKDAPFMLLNQMVEEHPEFMDKVTNIIEKKNKPQENKQPVEKKEAESQKVEKDEIPHPLVRTDTPILTTHYKESIMPIPPVVAKRYLEEREPFIPDTLKYKDHEDSLITVKEAEPQKKEVKEEPTSEPVDVDDSEEENATDFYPFRFHRFDRIGTTISATGIGKVEIPFLSHVCDFHAIWNTAKDLRIHSEEIFRDYAEMIWLGVTALSAPTALLTTYEYETFVKNKKYIKGVYDCEIFAIKIPHGIDIVYDENEIEESDLYAIYVTDVNSFSSVVETKVTTEFKRCVLKYCREDILEKTGEDIDAADDDTVWSLYDSIDENELPDDINEETLWLGVWAYLYMVIGKSLSRTSGLLRVSNSSSTRINDWAVVIRGMGWITNKETCERYYRYYQDRGFNEAFLSALRDATDQDYAIGSHYTEAVAYMEDVGRFMDRLYDFYYMGHTDDTYEDFMNNIVEAVTGYEEEGDQEIDLSASAESMQGLMNQEEDEDEEEEDDEYSDEEEYEDDEPGDSDEPEESEEIPTTEDAEAVDEKESEQVTVEPEEIDAYLEAAAKEGAKDWDDTESEEAEEVTTEEPASPANRIIVPVYNK